MLSPPEIVLTGELTALFVVPAKLKRGSKPCLRDQYMMLSHATYILSLLMKSFLTVLSGRV